MVLWVRDDVIVISPAPWSDFHYSLTGSGCFHRWLTLKSPNRCCILCSFFQGRNTFRHALQCPADALRSVLLLGRCSFWFPSVTSSRSRHSLVFLPEPLNLSLGVVKRCLLNKVFPSPGSCLRPQSSRYLCLIVFSGSSTTGTSYQWKGPKEDGFKMVCNLTTAHSSLALIR